MAASSFSVKLPMLSAKAKRTKKTKKVDLGGASIYIYICYTYPALFIIILALHIPALGLIWLIHAAVFRKELTLHSVSTCGSTADSPEVQHEGAVKLSEAGIRG